jgi:hypothetical protein
LGDETTVTTKKKFYLSKTLWLNAIAAVALFAQAQFGFVVSPEMQAFALMFLNMVVRIVTKEPLS